VLLPLYSCVVLSEGAAVKRLRTIGALALAACAAGCATTWSRPGAEGQDRDRENIECQFEASKLVGSAGLEGIAAEHKRVELESLCMQSKGWARR
jgi:hypothetical protein